MKQHWFFEGYQAKIVTDETGKERKKLIYCGECYGIPRQRPVKLASLLMLACLTVSYLLINLFPGEIGMSRWVGAPCLLVLVPLIFQWIGMVNFLMAGEAWEVRAYYAGYRRLKRWTIPCAVLLGITLLTEIGVCLTRGILGGAVPYLLGTILCILCASGLLLLQRRYPASIVKSPARQ